MTAPILSVEDLHKEFHTHGTVVRAVDGVSFAVAPGETLALVGESGSGKSTTARCVVRLTDPTAGRIRLRDQDIASLPRRRMRALRRDIQMVFQDPHASLNPSMTVRQTLREPLKLHGDADRFSHRDGNDDFTQPGNLFRLFDYGQKQRLFDNIAAAMQGVPETIVRRQIALFAKCDPAYGAGVARALKLDAPGDDRIKGTSATDEPRRASGL